MCLLNLLCCFTNEIAQVLSCHRTVVVNDILKFSLGTFSFSDTSKSGIQKAMTEHDYTFKKTCRIINPSSVYENSHMW